MIQLKNLDKSVSQGNGRLFILRQITLDIAQGEFVSIMGPSGAGSPRCSPSSACSTATGPASTASSTTPCTR